jgi:RNA polymerase sigma-70 factor (ECF subfamily)
MDSVATKLAVRDALGALSPEHRQVLELTLDRDLRQADIAALLGIPLGTVKTRMHYALKALKLALDERGIHG